MMTLATLFLISLVSLGTAELPLDVVTPSGYTKLRSWANCSLYRIEAETTYDYAPLLIHLPGSRYDIGYGYGYLLANEIAENYQSLMKSLLGEKWYDELLLETVALALDWQWTDYLSKELPVEYKMELQGLADGSKAAGCSECGNYANRAIVLANAPGDLKDFMYILMREFDKSLLYRWGEGSPPPEQPRGMQCSMFAVWGSRTEGGSLYSARNLDWNKDTGVNRHKVVMVVVPDDGGIPSATLGFACLYGTLAGMSAKGLTVHEANLEENKITFYGFPWTLRLRYIMEFSSNLLEGRTLWASTNNTVGFNHMIASAPDAEAYRRGTSSGPVAYALETMYQYTAYFPDNDPREANAMYNDSGTTVHIGFPMKEAVWRTNHGYDPVIREHYEWSQSPSSWSMQRYMFIHNALATYQTEGKAIERNNKEETGHVGSRGGSKVDSQSKFNMTEATKIVEIAEKLVCHFRVPNSEIAILTPYSAQKEAISEELKKKIEQQRRRQGRKLNDNIQVKTITESQGSEYGVVLLSTVRSRRMMTGGEGETADIGWIRKNLGFVADSHRICVGITRSKFGLVIVGNENVLKYDRIQVWASNSWQ